MTRIRIASLLALVVALPAAAGSSYLATQAHPAPCFTAGATGYRFSGAGEAGITVRIDDKAAHSDLRLQLVDDPAKADFMLIDGSGSDEACRGAAAIKSIRLDDHAREPDLTVALSRSPAPYKIFVRSQRFSARQAAALFAVLWRGDKVAAARNNSFAHN